VTLRLDYTLASEYVFRGVNFSKPGGLNHQMTVGLSYDAGAFGTLDVAAWFEWFAGQRKLTPDSGLTQEVDFTLSWSYEIPATGLTFSTGWIFYVFPQQADDAQCTQEWFASLSLDDSALFGTEGPVLSPYVAYYLDVDDVQGSWIEWGVSHDFPLAELGLAGVPVLKDLTVSPSFVMGIDCGQNSPSCRLANLVYGLDVSLDLNAALSIPDAFGSLSLTGFLRFSDAVFDAVLDDELWGGLTLAWEM